MRVAPLGALALSLSLGIVLTLARLARADAPVPPWVDVGVPFPSWARSVVPRPGEHGRGGDMVLFSGPSRSSGKRGVTTTAASLPLFGAHAGAGCSGEWWLVGPLAWTCSDDATLSPADAVTPPAPVEIDGLPREYFFVG